MDFTASIRRQETSMPASLERHIVIAGVLLFLFYLKMGQSFTEIPMTGGIYFQPVLTFTLLAFGVYLVYISRQYFQMLAQKCRKKAPWGKQLFFYYCAVFYLLALAYFTSWIQSIGVMYMQCFLFLACLSNLIIVIRLIHKAGAQVGFFAICTIVINALLLISSLPAFTRVVFSFTGAYLWGSNAF
jgi:hypothetical protein